MDELTSEQRDELRSLLLALGDELRETVASLAAGARPVDLDQPIGRLSRMDAIAQQSMARANRDSAKLRLLQVDAALHRIEEDDYGDCGICGEPIGFGRLSVRPEAPLCISCQSEREDRG
jgi:DnaK suppressor protein